MFMIDVHFKLSLFPSVLDGIIILQNDATLPVRKRKYLMNSFVKKKQRRHDCFIVHTITGAAMCLYRAPVHNCTTMIV